MKSKYYTVIAGVYFTIEWYFDSNNQSLAKDYFGSLDGKRKSKAFALFYKMVNAGKIFDKTKFRNEGDKLYTFKPQPDRFLCFFFEGKKIIITNAFHKKTEKLPKLERKRAIKSKKDYEERNKKGIYYEKI